MSVSEINSKQSTEVVAASKPFAKAKGNDRLAQIVKEAGQPREVKKRPTIWQQMKRKMRQCSQSVSEFGQRHEKGLKAAGVTAAVVGLAGAYFTFRKSAGSATLNNNLSVKGKLVAMLGSVPPSNPPGSGKPVLELKKMEGKTFSIEGPETIKEAETILKKISIYRKVSEFLQNYWEFLVPIPVAALMVVYEERTK